MGINYGDQQIEKDTLHGIDYMVKLKYSIKMEII